MRQIQTQRIVQGEKNQKIDKTLNLIIYLK